MPRPPKAPARLAFETGPEGDRHRRYELTHERMVARRIHQFINIRIKGASGAFDPTDVHLQDLLGAARLGTAQPRAEARPVIEAVGEADRDSHHHDARVFLAEVNDSGDRENDGRESQNDAPPAHIERASLDATPEFEEAYDEPTILRNEAIVSVVGCQSSVVRSEFEAINDAKCVRCRLSVVRCRFGRGGSIVTAARERRAGRLCGRRSLEAMIDIARKRAEFENRTPFRAERSPKSHDLARRQADEPGAGAGPGPIRNGLEYPSPRDRSTGG